MRLAVAGFGYWGRVVARAAVESPYVSLDCVCDLDADRLDEARLRHPGVTVTADHRQAFEQADAAFVATPLATHHAVALDAIRAGCHVIIAKPLARTEDECVALAEAAESRGVTLMVDHTFIYTAAVGRLQGLVDGGDLGRVVHVDSVRANLGLYQPDCDVAWDLASHDLAILDRLFGPPVEVSMNAHAALGSGQADLAYLALSYGDDGPFAHVHVSWLSPVKVRRFAVVGDRRMAVWDDTEPSEKIRIYDSGIEVPSREAAEGARVSYRRGDVLIPALDACEALQVELRHFVRCVREPGSKPLTDAWSGGRVVACLEAASASARVGGEWVPVRNFARA